MSGSKLYNTLSKYKAAVAIKKNHIKNITKQQIQLIKQEPVAPHYNRNSIILIASGMLGFTGLLKFQNMLSKYVPAPVIVEQPFPYDKQKLLIGKQSLYYYCQSMYFQALSAWTIVFLRRSRMISPITYMVACLSFLGCTYLTNYYKHPNIKHIMWFMFNLTFGAMIGSYMYQQGFKFMIDALYLVGNAMTFYAASTYYSENNKAIILTAFLCTVFGTAYGLGVLRLFRWGQDLTNRNVYIAALSILTIIQSWSIHRNREVQHEYDFTDYNPINASLSYSWRQIPQLIVFSDIFHQNHKHTLTQLPYDPAYSHEACQ